MRKQMVEAVSQFVETEERACLLYADTGAYGFRTIRDKCPQKVIDIGIMEDGMVGIAAGMALDGMIPTIYAMTPFIVERALEQLKLDFIYQNLQGNIITLGAAYDFSMLGYSHFCAEDYAILKNLPGLEFLAPGTGEELKSLYGQCCKDGGLSYFRMSDYSNRQSRDVVFGKAKVIKEGNDATVVVVGTMLDTVLDAVADENVTVLYYTTLAPFDGETLVNSCASGRILICEPQFSGSMDSEIMMCFSDRFVLMDHVGLPKEVYRNYGSKKEKDHYYGLMADVVKNKIDLLRSR